MRINSRITFLTLVAVTVLAASVSFGQSASTRSRLATVELTRQELKEPAATEKPERHPTIAPGPDYNPNAVLRAARIIFIRSKSAYLKSSDLENELRQRPEFAALGLLISKDEESADLILEVGRKVPGRKFVYTAIDPRTQIVLTSGSAKADLLGFEPSVAHKIAKRFLQRVQAVR
jgi:hypothetical protein